MRRVRGSAAVRAQVRVPGSAAVRARVVARAAVRAVARAPFARRAWAEVAYCMAGAVLGPVGFLLTAVLLVLGAALTLSLAGALVGVLLLAAAVALARASGGAQRALARGLLGERAPAPAPPSHPRAGGVLGRLDARLRGGDGWRAVAYVLVKLPVAVFGMSYALVWWLYSLLGVAFPLCWMTGLVGGPMDVLPPVPGAQLRVDSYPSAVVAAAVGLAGVLAAPWLTRAVVAADLRLLRALLGPGRLDQRVRVLEETRALAVDDAAATLRRLERDLHDGAQVRLVALAMSLAMAKEKLGDAGPPPDAERARRLVDTAHRNAAEALAELRNLSRGLHPPVLDDGLPDALATLAARSAVPVALTVDVPVRPTPSIEAIAYFCAAELLTNAVKHGAARHIAIEAVQRGGRLRLRVADDGRGGARPVAGGGLAGLAQRVRTVDGALTVASPRGGPTEVAVDLPQHA
ncbi:sensor domain-containing protein [Streptomyces varsoviensis]|uniref:sensor histidine kinase n=1 Tax=Streptomyces varsoviensis TaxID=67373 RepID=UPI0033E313DF